MKVLKWLLGTVAVLVLIVGLGVAALVYLVDWNDFKETIQNQVKKQTGRDLQIAGDLSPSFFPWAGISVGEIILANADGYGDAPFARIGAADVKVELLPLLKRQVNVRTVELTGLQLDLQRAEDGQTNWDDLLAGTATTTTTVEDSSDTEVTTEVEGSSATIAALAVGGIEILDANVSWMDAMTGTDAKLTGFNLQTDAIQLAKPFMLNVDFTVASNSMDLVADIAGTGQLMMDLDNQVYTVTGFQLDTMAKGGTLPNGELAAKLGADVTAKLADNTVDLTALSLASLGVQLDGEIKVTNLDTEPTVAGRFGSNDFSPRELFTQLGIEAPVTADETVLTKASIELALDATPASAAMNNLVITLDDTRFSGKASLPSLAGSIPPVRFDFTVDAIDLDRYLPPVAEEGAEGDAPAAESTDVAAAATDGDAPIELPTDMMRQLDIDGTFRVGEVKISNLTTTDIAVPVKAAGGKLALQDIQASLYEGQFVGTASMDVSADTPAYGVVMSLDGIQAEPLLGDLLQDDSFLSGAGEVAANITTGGNTVNAIKAGLNGNFNTAFTDGSINGINLGYQLRRARAAFTGQSLSGEEEVVKTDFSSLSVSGTFTDGVMNSDDLDMRAPLLRVAGAGSVDLPQEYVDYTVTTLVTGTAQGQGGDDLNSLKGLEVNIPIQATFSALAEDFAGVMIDGLKNNLTGNLKNQAKALADEKAAALKAEAEAKAEALKAQVEAAKDEKEAELKEKVDSIKEEALEKAGDKLKGLFK